MRKLELRLSVLTLLMVVCLGGCESNAILDDLLKGTASNGTLSKTTITQGLREALNVGSLRVVDTLSRAGGFHRSPFHIPLPDKLQRAKEVAGRFGLEGPFEDLELKMNRAAEAAVPEARGVFVAAVAAMTFDDVMGIYDGPDDAATQYLRRSTESQIADKMSPIIDARLDSVGAVRTLKDLIARYNALPLVDPIDADIGGHVRDYAMDALFSRLAFEEAAIRNEPIKRTTALLKTVFG